MSERRKAAILGICCLNVLIVGIDVTAVNFALPPIGVDLGAGIAGLQWTLDAYTVVLASLLIAGGSIADRFGRKPVLLTGLGVFSLASLLCSLAPTIGFLIGFRALQAVGASMMTPVAMSILANTFTEPRRRAQVIGYWNAVFGVAMALGPVVGGLLVSAIDWRAIFWINIPVGLAAVSLTARFIPDSRAVRARRLDWPGQLLIVAMLGTLTYGIIEAPHRGWTSAATIGTFAVSALALAGLLLCEARRREPLIDLRLFRSIPFSSSVAIAIASFAAFGGFLFLNTIYLQQDRGLSPLHAGLAMIPMAAGTVLISPISGRIVAHRGPRLPLVGAGVCFAVSCAMLIGLSASTPIAWILLSYAIFGIGFGAVNPPISEAAVAGMPLARAGVAAALTTTSRQVGQTLGVAVVGAIVATGATGSLPATSRSAWWILTAISVLVIAMGVLATSGFALATARRSGRIS